MNAGVFGRTLREVLPVTVICGAALLLVVALLAYILPTFQEGLIEELWQISFVRTIVQAALGAEVGDRFGPEMAGAFAWSHPVVIALVTAYGMIVCTRVPAGEVDRGTIDLLLGLPVSRWQVYVTETVAWVGGTVILVACALLGHVLGAGLAGAETPPMGWQRIPVAANLLAVSLAFGALSWWVSALSDRRGKAIAVAFGIVLPAFLVNYLRQFWTPAGALSIVSPLRYYQPFVAMREGGWPWSDLAVLLAIAFAAWIGAGITFARRDLCTT